MATLIKHSLYTKRLSENSKLEDYDKVNETFVNSVLAYTDFVIQKIQLGHFVPCDKKGKPFGQYVELGKGLLQEYKEAQEKVIFKCKICIFSEEHIRIDFENTDSLHWYKGTFDSYCGITLKYLEDLSQHNLEVTDHIRQQFNL